MSQLAKTRVLTGITTTGTPHLGNYVGAIKPAIEASQDPNVQSLSGGLPRADQVPRPEARAGVSPGDRRDVAGAWPGYRQRDLLPPVGYPGNSRADVDALLRVCQGANEPCPRLQSRRGRE